MYAVQSPNGQIMGVTEVFGAQLRTTGLLGASKDDSGMLSERGFPSWLTIPSNQYLAMGRRWHFFFAWLLVVNGLLYVMYSIAEPSFIPRPCPDAPGLALHRALDSRPSALQAPARRRLETV